MKVNESDCDLAKQTEEKRKAMNELVGLNNIHTNESIILVIDDWCSQHIKTLHKEYPNQEWLAVCKVKPTGEGTFIMTDMLFPWQTTSSWDVETTKEWMEWLTKELIRRWEKMTDWNCILHSHHRMGCFWSWTDDKARLGLNDWRQLAWAVVTSYEWDKINYKGCINFYKPYNIEIDVDVREIYDNPLWYDSIVDRYGEYLDKVKESEARFYEFLLDTNKNYIDSITDRPSYKNILEYLWVDITEELNSNYDTLKDKIWNPELKEYLKQLWDKANELAEKEINSDWKYTDMLIEYDAFCKWSDWLLTQLEEHKQKSYSFGTLGNFWAVSGISSSSQPSLLNSSSMVSNRDFDDDDDYEYWYQFSAPECNESYVRQMLGIDYDVPMKVWDYWERLAWSNEDWDYLYVEDWANRMYL